MRSVIGRLKNGGSGEMRAKQSLLGGGSYRDVKSDGPRARSYTGSGREPKLEVDFPSTTLQQQSMGYPCSGGRKIKHK